MATEQAPQTGRWRWVLPVAAVVGIGPWGGVAGMLLFVSIAIWLGAPRTFDSWGLWFGLLGMTLGFAASSWGAVWLVRRSPRVLGTIAVVVALLVIVSGMASGGYEMAESLLIFGPGALLAVVVLYVGRRRRNRRLRAPQNFFPADVENPGPASTPG